MVTIYPAWMFIHQKIINDLLIIENESFNSEQAFDAEEFKEFHRYDYNFLAVDDGKVIGYIMCEDLDTDEEALKDYPELITEKVLHIISIALKIEYRGKHLAGELIDQVKRVAYNQGYKYLLLDATNEVMRHSAEHAGFKVVRYFDVWGMDGVKSWMMTWEVNDYVRD